jgi:hypothetical protein
MRHMTRSQHAKARGGATWSSSTKGDKWSRHVANASGERWSRQVTRVKPMTHRLRTVRANSLCINLIMVSGGQLIRSIKLVGNQGMKALMQMVHAYSSADAQMISQDDVRSRLKLTEMKASSTSHKVDFVTYLFDTSSTLIITWGNLDRCSSLLGKILFVVLVSHSHPVLP